MPSHRTHEVIGVITSPLIFAGAFTYTADSTTAVALTVGYIVATYFFSPDLDIDSAPYYRWPIPIWYPYKQIIPHRSWLSHSGPISGTIRFLYFLFIVAIIASFFSIDLLTYTWIGGILWLSIILADSVHTVLDLIWKG